MNRRNFFLAAAAAAAPGVSFGQNQGGVRILLPELPAASPVTEAVLFAFDDRAFPST